MPVTIAIPTALRQFADKQITVSVEAATVGEAVKELTSKHQSLGKHLLDENGKMRNFVNLYLNDEDVRSLKGPETALKDGDELLIVPAIAGGATLTEDLSKEEVARYSRHLIMPEVGKAGQLKLKKAKVLMIGAGGLGAPMGLYLAAAGVGRIGIVDFDVVDDSNLQRQILFGKSSVGRKKIEAAKERLEDLNPYIEIVSHETQLTSENALDLFKQYDLVVDGTDNFPTRYLVNDACVLTGIPNVYASIFRFEGQVSVFYAKEGPCYRCLYPDPPPPGLVPSCAEGGVLGVLPGTVGALQATEAIKLILQTGDPLIGTLLTFDALGMNFRKLKLRRDPDCPVCGNNPTITELIDYEQFCGIKKQEAAPVSDKEMTVQELKQQLDAKEDFFLLDVREPHEIDICKIEASIVIPMGEVENRLNEIPKDKQVVVHCRSGGRSGKITGYLKTQGYTNVINLEGGILAWAEKIDTSMPSY
ncbi:MAG: molybdenum cofactor biosynthesis protein MoeB [Elusimicrobia bacterium]|nr:MAG: molybdenum cofactor biosynthesis protein MoeB [Elusimicrobiota bacterium]